MTEAQKDRMDALPNIDVEVFFALNSANFTPRAFATLAIIGRALSDSRLADQAFLIGGHTDASGSPGVNLRLSEARAQAVRTFLINQFKIAPERLLARGFGEERLKNRRNPYSGQNRRVQIVNWTSEMAQQPQPDAAPPAQPPRRRR